MKLEIKNYPSEICNCPHCTIHDSISEWSEHDSPQPHEQIDKDRGTPGGKRDINERFTSRQRGLLFDNKINGECELPLYASPEKVAEIADVSRSFVYEEIARGNLNAKNPGGSTLRRVHRTDLEAWLNKPKRS